LLEGKVAIVTGAGRGIGRAIALGYARAGAAVCCAARTRAEIDATVHEIACDGGQAIAVPTDVTDPASARTMVESAVERFGGLDIVVVNAGVNGERNPVEVCDLARWRLTLDVNVYGALHCAQAAIPHLRKRGGGKIIMVGSGVGHRGLPGHSAYACSKAALWMLTRVLAQELAADNISVNELIPGPVVTALSQSQASQGRGVFGIPGEWVKSPEDVVPLALFLATQPAIGPTAQSFSLMRRDN
jgi:3-oxoacyl-[acyl-carrier protein] reductase